VVPTVTVRCPGGLYDRQGRLQNPEAGDIADGSDCKVSAFSTSFLNCLNLAQGCGRGFLPWHREAYCTLSTGFSMISAAGP